MLFISMEDFLKQTSALAPITRQEELDCAQRMLQGDADARQRIIDGYLPMVAAHVRRMPYQTAALALHCVQALEKAVDSFNFLQESETFAHRLSWALRQTSTRYIAEHPIPSDDQ